MSTLQEIEALFVGKTIKSVNLAPRAEYNSIQIYSVTFTDGSTIHFGGEHDCAYLDGRSQDGEYLDGGLDLDVPEEEPEPVATPPAEVGSRLRDVLPPEYIPAFEAAKPRYKAMLDYIVIEQGTPWPINNIDAKGVLQTFVVAWPKPDPESRDYDWRTAQTTGRKTMVGIKQGPWNVIFADTRDGVGYWIPDYMVPA